ncbi:hypothetical protein RchiOBHm_Chr2g0125131 [Rosa chinensis]|uniref:Uncharacterized protein n=1 Tax=Rosa chinensis TaxID=74649 RepID=A0A2P6RTH2_ROSCH|nr:hypothetical protein RchiOBHm_Chr2g0125131 [Rosa chinensis]
MDVVLIFVPCVPPLCTLNPRIERSLFAYTTNDISGLNCALALSASIFGAVAGD